MTKFQASLVALLAIALPVVVFGAATQSLILAFALSAALFIGSLCLMLGISVLHRDTSRTVP